MPIYQDGELVLYGFVGDSFFDEGFTSSQVLEALAQHGRDRDITVRINSGGGIAWEGMAIYNALVAHRGDVRVEVDSIAASSASLIAMAGDLIVLRAGAMMMIHDPAVLTMGNVDEHGRSIEFLDRLGRQMASIYADRSGNDADAVRDAMKGELWMTADEAVAQGYADEAESTKARAASAFDYRIYAHAPRRLVAMAERKNWSFETKTDAASASPLTRQKEHAMSENPAAEVNSAQPAPEAHTEPKAEAKPAPQPEASVPDPRARIKAILALDEAKDRSAMAQTLALETDLPVEQAKAILASAPVATAQPDPAAAYEADRVNAAGALAQPVASGNRSHEPDLKADEIYSSRAKARAAAVH
jgi:ATP-dependent Clp protease, protease subunit